MAGRTLLADRYLLGIHKADISPATLFSICTQMGMPEKYLDALKEEVQEANAVHFGFEGSETGGIYKVYLEFAGRLGRCRADALQPVQAVLLHLAYKWDVVDRHVGTIARYECHPGLSNSAMLERLAGCFSGHNGHKAVEAVRAIIALAAGRAREPLMYLEVSEEDNPRASIDINLHDAGMRVQEIELWLSQLREHFAIPDEQFAPLIGGVKEASLGHLSAGISREGREFVTVYYAADALCAG